MKNRKSHKERESIKKNQINAFELYNTQNIQWVFSIAEWRRQKKNISDLEDKTIEMTQTEQQRDHKLKKTEPILKNPWNYKQEI